jgi:hypothetical protein
MSSSKLSLSKIKSIVKSKITISRVKGQSKYKSHEKIEWKGFFRYYGYFFSLYLNNKYNNVCMKPGLNLSFNGNKIEFNFEGKEDKGSTFFEFIKTCKKRFIVFPITIQAHQNILIYDTVLKEVELFDPYGENAMKEFQNVFNNDTFKKFVHEGFDKYYMEIEELFQQVDKSIKFYKPVSFFPKDKEFQTFEINACPKEKFKINSWGFCVVWCFWYTENRLRYPNKSRTKLVKTLLDLFHKDIETIKKSANKSDQKEEKLHLPICKIIRGYASFLQNIDKDLSYFDKLKLDVKLHKDIYYAQVKLYTFMISFFALYGYTVTKFLV